MCRLFRKKYAVPIGHGNSFFGHEKVVEKLLKKTWSPWSITSTVPIGPDVRIFPHAVNQRSDWSAAEASECHVKFS